MRTHSPFGASKASRWLNCLGSVHLCKQVPEQETSTYAAEGQAAHQLAEKVLNDTKAGLDRDQLYAKYHGDTVESDDGREYRVTDEMFDAVMVYRDAILDDIQLYAASLKDLMVETGFTLSKVSSEAYGTSDAVLLVPMDRLIVYDFKYGKGHMVSVEENEQLLYYALGASGAIDADDFDELVNVELVIVQPRGYDLPVKRITYPVKKLAQFEERLQIAMYHIERGTMTTTPGSWCKWCDAKSICHSFKEVSKLASGPLQNLARDTVSTPSPAAMTTEEISKVLKNAVLIKLWADSVAEYATKIAKEGSKIPGYKLIQKKGNLAWKDESVAVKRFKERYGDDIFKKTLLTPTQMKKLVGKESAHEVEEIAERADKDLALVPESDKGEPVVINRLKVFDQFSNDVLEDL